MEDKMLPVHNENSLNFGKKIQFYLCKTTFHSKTTTRAKYN